MDKNVFIKKIACSVVFPVIAIFAYLLLEVIPLDFLGYHKKSINISSINLVNVSLDNDVYTTLNDDPQLFLNNIHSKIRTIEIELDIKNSSVMETELYFDYGQGMNQQNTQSTTLKNGRNTISLNTKRELINLRIDPSNKANDSFNISSVIINANEVNYRKMIVVFLFILLQFIFNIKSEKYILYSASCVPVHYLWFQFYYKYGYVRTDNFIYQVLVLGFVISFMYILKLMVDKIKEVK